MTALSFDNVQVVAWQEPDSSTETAADGSKFQVELPGHFYVGVVVGGVRVPIFEKSAAGLLADMAAVAAQTPPAPVASPDQTPPAA
jgi:hypothetical protein